MKNLTIVGSTGSIGRSTLKVVEHLRDRLKVFALGAHRAVDLLAAQTAAFHPQVVAIGDASRADEYVRLCRESGITRIPEVVTGEQGMRRVCSAREVDTVVAAAVGAAGLQPTWAAVASGKTVALANKEAMVMAGEILSKAAAQTGARILPVDSEHCAIDQCIRSGRHEEVHRLILTASGGPFRETPADDLERVTRDQALNHPTWRMGERITIDSATLMNKGLEVIEARWLFDIPAERVDITVHPQSIVHSMVEFRDGSVIAQLSATDMRQPIQYALTYPERLDSAVPRLDWSAISRLDFMDPDTLRFPCLELAYEAIRRGGIAPAVLNAADEVAVAAFLSDRIGFMDIPRIIRATLDAASAAETLSLEGILEADRWAREFASRHISHARIRAI
jgi:1-deoxy-D-xylulose-5-phosphate reductoisomerase